MAPETSPDGGTDSKGVSLKMTVADVKELLERGGFDLALSAAKEANYTITGEEAMKCADVCFESRFGGPLASIPAYSYALGKGVAAAAAKLTEIGDSFPDTLPGYALYAYAHARNTEKLVRVADACVTRSLFDLAIYGYRAAGRQDRLAEVAKTCHGRNLLTLEDTALGAIKRLELAESEAGKPKTPGGAPAVSG